MEAFTRARVIVKAGGERLYPLVMKRMLLTASLLLLPAGALAQGTSSSTQVPTRVQQAQARTLRAATAVKRFLMPSQFARITSGTVAAGDLQSAEEIVAATVKYPQRFSMADKAGAHALWAAVHNQLGEQAAASGLQVIVPTSSSTMYLSVERAQSKTFRAARELKQVLTPAQFRAVTDLTVSSLDLAVAEQLVARARTGGDKSALRRAEILWSAIYEQLTAQGGTASTAEAVRDGQAHVPTPPVVTPSPPSAPKGEASFLGDYLATLTRNRELFAAAQAGNISKAYQLLEAGADVNTRDQYGNTPLIAAAHLCKTEMVRVLLKAGADAAIRNDDGYTAEDEAIFSLCDGTAAVLRRR